MTQPKLSSGRSALPDLIVPFTIVTLVVVYMLIRQGGLWGEIDTAAATAAMRAILDTDMLAPTGGRTVYPNGYSFQVFGVFLMEVSGLSLPALQVFFNLLLILWLVVPAWLAYRALTGSTSGAALATLLLFTQPEFLFVISRGTHEKFTRGLTFLCLYVLLKAFHSRNKPALLATMIVLYYVFAYGMIAHNNLLYTSFATAVWLSLVLCLISSRWSGSSLALSRLALRRLTYMVASSTVIAFLFIFFAYPPARHNIDVIQSMVDRVAALFLDVEEGGAVNPYTTWVTGGWTSLQVYFLVSLANWVLLLSSASIWMGQTLRWLLRGKAPQDASALILWSFYGAFAFLGALSIIVDISGALDSNLQHRIFPSFAMIGAAVLAKFLVELPRSDGVGRRLLFGSLVVLVGLFTILSTLKATNDPIVSNKWQFYSVSEARALDWFRGNLSGRTLWAEYDERLQVADRTRTAAERRGFDTTWGAPSPAVRDFLLSEITRARAARIGAPLPIAADSLITYDNGRARVYHLRPRTPYQR